MPVTPEWGDTITVGNLARVLESAAKAFNQVPNAIIANAESGAVTALDRFERELSGILKRFSDFEARCDELEQEAYNKFEDSYKKVSKAHKDLNERLMRLAPLRINPDIKIWELKDLVEVSEKLARLDETGFNRMLRIFELYAQETQKE